MPSRRAAATPPKQDVLAADTVLEVGLTLEHEYCSAGPCHRCGERSTTNAASNRDDVDVHAQLPPDG
jgi:hypothetical protein